MLGAIAGDIIGSVYEVRNLKSTDFELYQPESRFTDDTVLTVAVADCLLNGKDYTGSFKYWGQLYPNAGYGGTFRRWLASDNAAPYNSWGNGSAMRVSPVGFAAATLEEAIEEAAKSAAVTHNHHEGIKGAQATAAAVFMAKHGSSKQEIKEYVQTQFGYDLSRRLDDIREVYKFDVSCQGSVPESMIAFLESEDFESAVRLGISIGGDSDTIACIAGSIAQAFYKKIPPTIVANTFMRLTPAIQKVTEDFNRRFEVKF